MRDSVHPKAFRPILAGAFLLLGALPVLAAGAAATLDRTAYDDPTRPEDDRKQDAGRKAIEMYEWVGIRPGMTVADLFCSDGYNTQLLSRVVGKEGAVKAVLEFYADKEAYGGNLYQVDHLKERVDKAHLDNVEMVMKIGDLEPASVDAMIAVRNYHDVEWVFEGLKRKDVVAGIYAALKPGGVIGIVEVATPTQGWDEKAHRLNEQVVIDDFTAGGFEPAGRSDLLANPQDDHTGNGFKQGRYNQDRYLLRFRKPTS